MVYKKILLLFVGLVFGFNVFSQTIQEKNESSQKIRAAKVAHITQKLALTPTEAEKFWPVYNKFDIERWELRQSHHKLLKNKDINFEKLTDSQAEELINTHLKYRQDDIDLEKKYMKEFKQVLPLTKVAKLFNAERSFQTEILKRLRNKD